MARRKKTQPPLLSSETIRNIALVVILVLGVFFLIRGGSAFLKNSDLFDVKEIVVTRELQMVDIPELKKIKGRNIFFIDVGYLEKRIRTQYPSLADLKVMRRLPDQVVVSALKREPFAKVVMQGQNCLIDKDGYVLGAAGLGSKGLATIVGLKDQRPVAGRQVMDRNIQFGIEIIERFQDDVVPPVFPLREVNVKDPSKIKCLLGSGDVPDIEVIVDPKGLDSKARKLRALFSSRDVDLEQVSYMDLRFDEPVIGKKVKK